MSDPPLEPKPESMKRRNTFDLILGGLRSMEADPRDLQVMSVRLSPVFQGMPKEKSLSLSKEWMDNLEGKSGVLPNPSSTDQPEKIEASIPPRLSASPIPNHRGSRIVPITFGSIELLTATLLFYFFGSNIITWIIGGFLLWLSVSTLKMGIFGSRRLIDEMTSSPYENISEETKEELKKHHGIT